MPLNRHLSTTIAVAVSLTTATAFMTYGTWDDTDPTAYRFGLTIAVLTTAAMLSVSAMRTSARSLERARLDSYDDGFAAGCRAATRATSAGGTPLALVRAADEFGEEHGLGSGADRVG